MKIILIIAALVVSYNVSAAFSDISTDFTGAPVEKKFAFTANQKLTVVIKPQPNTTRAQRAPGTPPTKRAKLGK